MSKAALSVVPCPFFLIMKKKFCRFHEVGQCCYEHSSSLTSAGEVLYAQEAPDPPPFSVPLSSSPTNTGPLLPQATPANDAGYSIQTYPALFAHSSTETIPLETREAEIQTTSSALSMADKESQTGPQDLVDVIKQEKLSLMKQLETIHTLSGKDYKRLVASKVTHGLLSLLNEMEERVLQEDASARIRAYESKPKPLQIFGQHLHSVYT